MLDLAVLGLLRRHPHHGYELKRQLAELGFLRVSFGSLYPALRRLEKRGLIEALRQTGRRKAYRLTDKGASEFARILDTDTTETEEDRRFNMRLAFFEYLEPPARLRTLKRRRSQLVARLTDARRALRDVPAAGPVDHYTMALLKHNVGAAEADIGWLDELIAHARAEHDVDAPRMLMGGQQ
jgi:DNA-binding PadR family transcriptional regulator